jgi:predicted DNA-binding protein (UPF0251 family)
MRNLEMSRPQKERMVHTPPLFAEFKPVGVVGKMLQEVNLSLDEYEAFRLADYEGYDHLQASEEMEISRSTFTRLIESARKKIAVFIIKGNKLVIEGGNIHFRNNIIKCNSCGYMFNIQMNSSLAKCPNCDSTELINVAGQFGHGKCCRNFRNNRRCDNART